MIRLILLFFFVALFLVLSIPLMIAEYIIGKFNPDLKSRSSRVMVGWSLTIMRYIAGTKVDYIGIENIPTDTAVLYVGNHRSYFDIVLTYPAFPRPTGYIAKKEVGMVPLLNIWMKNVHCLLIDRKDLKAGMQTILDAADLVKDGKSICVFPEGTRSKSENEFLPFFEGSFKIAVKSGCPIVPLVINNSAAIFENQFPFVKKAHVIIEFGKPVYVKDLPKEHHKHLAPYFQEVMKGMHEVNAQKV